jgi:ubiquitin-protein ligase
MSLCRAGLARLQREFVLLQKDPPPGISARPNASNNDGEPTQLTKWTATIEGPRESPFEGVLFQVTLQFPERYPMDPPWCQFAGPWIPFHPNVDGQGRICLDTLKRPPSGSWSPAVSLSSLLLSLQLLLGEPNADDGLEPESTKLYLLSRIEWHKEARRRIQQQQQQQSLRKRPNDNKVAEGGAGEGATESTGSAALPKRQKADGVSLQGKEDTKSLVEG